MFKWIAGNDFQIPITSVDIPTLSGSDLFDGLVNAAFGLAGLICVVAIIVGGYWYVFSQGDSSKVAKGKNAILYGIVGLVITLLAFVIMQLVITAVTDGF